MSLCIAGACYFVFFFKQKTAYEMRISDWSSDVCSSDLLLEARQFVGIDFLLRGLGFRDPLEQQPGPVGRSDGRTHEQRQIMLIDEHPLGGDARPIFTVELGGEL